MRSRKKLIIAGVIMGLLIGSIAGCANLEKRFLFPHRAGGGGRGRLCGSMPTQS